MLRTLQLVTGPATEPLTLADAKSYLRIDDEDQDTEVLRLIATAREFVEEQTGRALITQTWKLTLDRWPTGPGAASRTIVLDRSPLASVTSVQYYPDGSGTLSTVDAADYHVLTPRDIAGRIILDADAAWPDADDRPDAIQITYVSGDSSAGAVKPIIKQAVLLMVKHQFENRLPVMTAGSVNELPFSLKHLIESQRVGGWIG